MFKKSKNTSLFFYLGWSLVCLLSLQRLPSHTNRGFLPNGVPMTDAEP